MADRDTTNGRFVAGNRFGKGRPRNRPRREVIESVSPDARLIAVLEKLYEKAIEGDTSSATQWLDRVLSKAARNDDKLEDIEERIDWAFDTIRQKDARITELEEQLEKFRP